MKGGSRRQQRDERESDALSYLILMYGGTDLVLYHTCLPLGFQHVYHTVIHIDAGRVLPRATVAIVFAFQAMHSVVCSDQQQLGLLLSFGRKYIHSTALRYDVAFIWSITPFYHIYAASTTRAVGVVLQELLKRLMMPGMRCRHMQQPFQSGLPSMRCSLRLAARCY
jgi:hypothetical protein